MRQNVLALLSLQRYRDRDRIEPGAVQRLYNRADDEVRTALRPFGYYEPLISSSIDGPDKPGGDVITVPEKPTPAPFPSAVLRTRAIQSPCSVPAAPPT